MSTTQLMTVEMVKRCVDGLQIIHDEQLELLRADNRAMTEKNTTLQRHFNERTTQLSETQDELAQWKDTATRLGEHVASLEATIKQQRDGMRLAEARRQPEPATIAAPVEIREEPVRWQWRNAKPRPNNYWREGDPDAYWRTLESTRFSDDIEFRAVWWTPTCR